MPLGSFKASVGSGSWPAFQMMPVAMITTAKATRMMSVSPGVQVMRSPRKSDLMKFKAHEVELSQPVDDWQSRILKPDFARFLKRKRKKLAAKGKLSFELASDPSRIRAAFEGMRHFRRSRWADDLLADSKHFEFYVEAAVSGHETGFTRTYILSVNDAIVSVVFGVWHRGRYSFLLSGFDREIFRNFSTGMLLLESVIEDCIRRADKCFDLTIGDEEYKQKFATRSVPMHVFWLGKQPWTSLAPLAFDAAMRARSLLGSIRKTKSLTGAS